MSKVTTTAAVAAVAAVALLGSCRREQPRELDEVAPTITSVANEVVIALPPEDTELSAEEMRARLDGASATEERRNELERRWARILEDGWTGSAPSAAQVPSAEASSDATAPGAASPRVPAPPSVANDEALPPEGAPAAGDKALPANGPPVDAVALQTEAPQTEALQAEAPETEALQAEVTRLRERLRLVEADLASLSERTSTLEQQNRALMAASARRRNQVQLLRMFLGLRTAQLR